MKKQRIQHHIDGLIALLLFGLFAACVLIVLLTGADAYRRLTARDQAAYDRRTCAQYIATRVRQADIAGGIAIEPFGSAQALALKSGDGYTTRIYCHDGYLMELYAADADFAFESGSSEGGLSPEDGAPIIAAEALALELSGGMLTASVTGPEGTDTLRLSLRSQGGAAA